jgi:hypothetical protein
MKGIWAMRAQVSTRAGQDQLTATTRKPPSACRPTKADADDRGLPRWAHSYSTASDGQMDVCQTLREAGRVATVVSGPSFPPTVAPVSYRSSLLLVFVSARL